jgi:hypothetical protein
MGSNMTALESHQASPYLERAGMPVPEELIMGDPTPWDVLSSQDLRWIFGILFSVTAAASGGAFCIAKLAIFIGHLI